MHSSEQTVCNASCSDPTKRKEQTLLALLKAPSRQPKTTTLQVRLEEDVRGNLDKYAEFLDANSSYVVSEGLKFLFRKDKQFKRWLGQHTNNPETQRHTRKEPVSKGESIQLQLK